MEKKDKQVFNLLTETYSIVLATSSQDMAEVEGIRKKTISTKYPEFQKTDEYKEYLYSKDDEQSFIYLLKYNPTNTYVGTVRVFFVNHNTPIQKIPMAEKCILDKNNILPICEISRLNLLGDIYKDEKNSGLEMRTYLSLALMTATRINFFLYKYSMVFSLMERSLDRILRRQGVQFQKVGEAIDFYGKRTPYAIERTELLYDTEATMGTLTRYYLKQMCENPEKLWQFVDNNPYLDRSDIQLDRICQLFKEYGDDVDIDLLLGEKSS